MKIKAENRSAIILILGVIIIAVTYQCLRLLPVSYQILDPISAVYNLFLTGILAFFVLKDEFIEWFKHFSIKWTLITIPSLLVASFALGKIWQLISGEALVENAINSMITWGYVATHIPFMLMGEELLSITLLFALWKKLNWKFWQASLVCAVLFAFWHIASYECNVLQILITIVAPRLILNEAFKKSNSIWTTWAAHVAFDIISFLPLLLK